MSAVVFGMYRRGCIVDKVQENAAGGVFYIYEDFFNGLILQ